jgi:predicted nucleic acid-binding protein
MKLEKVVIDTNLYIGWLNDGRHEHLMLGPGLARYLSAIVHMELSVGARRLPTRRALSQLVRAYRSGGRLVVPDADVFSRAGEVLRRLRDSGREVRKASLVNDVLISLSARSIGATVLTSDGDFEAIGGVVDFRFRVVPEA